MLFSRIRTEWSPNNQQLFTFNNQIPYSSNFQTSLNKVIFLNDHAVVNRPTPALKLLIKQLQLKLHRRVSLIKV